jgi:hypothetical protein
MGPHRSVEDCWPEVLASVTIRFAATRYIAEPTMTLQFSEEDLLRELGAATVGKGELLWIDDRVRQVQVAAGGTLISGSVLDSRPLPYSQTIMLASAARPHCLPACYGCAMTAAVEVTAVLCGAAQSCTRTTI